MSAAKQSVANIYRLSPLQEAMLAHARGGASAAYQDQVAFFLRGAVQAGLLAAAWNELVSRHEALRTSFVSRAGGPPLQVVWRDRPLTLREVDLGAHDVVAQRQALDELRRDERERPFDLHREPLLRLVLCRLAADRVVLVWTFHHIALDGWSKGVLLRELATVYGARLRGEEPILPPAIPYSRYVRWREAQDQEAARRYWRETLAGAPAATGPAARAPGSGYRVAELTATLDAATTAALRALGAARRLTPSALLQAAWAVVLARQSGSDDVVFGTVSSGREGAFPGIEQAVGLFVNTLAVRLRLARGDRLLEVAERAREATLTASRHAPLSVAGIARAAGSSRVIDHLLDVVNYPFDLASMLALGRGAGFAVEAVEALDQSDLDLNVFAALDAELRLTFNYNAEVYAGGDLAGVAEHLLDVLRDTVAAPHRPLGTRALLSRRERQQLAAARVAPLPAMAAIPAAAALSPHQERMWFIDRFESGTVYPSAPTYHNVPLLLRLRGRLDEERLQRALDGLVRRHQALRLRLGSRGCELFQQVAEPAAGLPLCRAAAAGDLPRALAAALAAAARPFQLGEGALATATLVPVAADDHLLVLTVHHAIVDRASTDLLARDLAAGYAGHVAEQDEPQYLQVAAWEGRALRAVEDLSLVHWRRHLAALPVLLLPTDRPRAAIHTYTAQRTPFTVPTALVARLQALADGASTVPALLLAAFAVLLQRYSGQRDVVLGTSDPRRRRDDLRGVVGPIANLRVLRLTLPPAASYRELAAAAERELAAGAERGDISFDRLVSALAPRKDMSRTALFDVLFTYEEEIEDVEDVEGVDERPLLAGELHFERLRTNLGWGKYDLALAFYAARAGGGAGQLRGELVSNRDHYEDETAARLVAHLLRLLAELTASPERAHELASCLSAEELQALAAESAPAAPAFPHAATLHGLCAEQAARAPDAIAVVAGDACLSYGALRARVRRVAALLRRRGVGAESRVGVLLDRGTELVVAVLAALEAGGAYVPLDPDFPRERLQLMVADAGIELVLTTSALARRLPAAAASGREAVRTVLLDAGGDEAAPPLRPARPPGALPRNLAYVIYTSGSTGRPKGVMVEHRQVVRLVRHEAPLFDFGAGDVWTLCHSASFDFSVWEIFAPLLTGGRLVVVPKATTRDAPALLSLLAEQRVTVLNQTPSSFANLSRAELAGAGPRGARLRYLIFGGEALQPRALAGWVAAHPDTRVINMYGITETTVHVTYEEIGAAEVAGNVCNIGRPIPTLGVALLDRDMRFVPPGVAGELCVAGAGVTRGYLGRPGLTADRFRPHPTLAGERCYRSGDLARRLPGGDLLYLGRGDQQVKVRGFRIEPGEIEHRLLEHPRVSAAAVLALGDGNEPQLVAHVVTTAELSVEALRAHLAERLPEHMMPARFVRLGALPLTPTGKTDRRALAALPPGDELALGNRFVAPRDTREAALAASWREVLHREQVGVHDSYFALGGDSINAIQVVARLRLRGLRLHIHDLFQHPTIAALAPRVTTVEETAAAPDPAPPPDREIPLTPIQRWFFATFPARPERFAHPVVLSLARRYPEAVVERALQEVVTHHPALAYTFTPAGGRWVQRQAGAGARLRLEAVDERPSPAVPDRLRRLAAQRLATLDLGSSPLHATLVHTDDGDRLLLLAHHLVVDGISWRVVLEDLALALDQASGGRPVALAAEITSFAQWAARLAGAAPAGEDEIAYWQGLEAACRPLPVDVPTGTNRFRDTAETVVALPADLGGLLLGAANRAYRTSPEDLLLAALARALRSWPGGERRERLVITLEGHGRHAHAGELGRTVGWFTDRYPFALELGDDGVASAVQIVKEARRRVPGGGAGYSRLRYPADGATGPPPGPALSFNYLGAVDLGAGDAFTVQLAFGWEASVDGDAVRPCELDASAIALNGRLELRLAYSRERLRARTVAALAERWQRELRVVGEHCAQRRAEVTPADLSYSSISLEDLEGIAS